MADSRTNLRTASLAIERNASYLHQFIHRGTPRVLAEDDREALWRNIWAVAPTCCGTAGASGARSPLTMATRPPDMVRPRKPEAERRSRTICVRATTAEAAAIAERAAAAG